MPTRAQATLAVLLLAGFTACSGPRQLETSLGGRPLEELRATATKAGDRWQCELQLPLGVWRVETREAQDVEIIPDKPRATLRWKVAPDRWSQQDRPFTFDLVGEGGLRLSLVVRYPNSLPGQNLVLNVFRSLTGS